MYMETNNGKEIHRYSQEEELAVASADFIIEKAREAITTRGRFNIALTGAFNVLDTYRQLPGVAAAKGVDWLGVFLFWSDERCVPPSQPDNHYRMVHTNLISHIPIPDGNIHPIQCEEDPKGEAERYEQILRSHFSPKTSARFDLILLGLGTEGQVGSFYPQSMVLEEKERWVVAEFVEHLGEWRLTLTPHAVNQARDVLVLARGKEKSEAVHQSLNQEEVNADWPASYLHPEDGEIHWFLDEASATLLLAEHKS